MIKKEMVLEKLKEVIDPELGVDLVTAGMIKDVKVRKDKVIVEVFLTSPFCPLRSYLHDEVYKKVKNIKGIKEVKVNLL